jgi:hypothetical protein
VNIIFFLNGVGEGARVGINEVEMKLEEEKEGLVQKRQPAH